MPFTIGREQMKRLMDAKPEVRARLITLMSPNDMLQWDANFESWAHDAQLPPSDVGWRNWLMMAGRGFGKTRAGAEWIHALACAKPKARIALAGASLSEIAQASLRGLFRGNGGIGGELTGGLTSLLGGLLGAPGRGTGGPVSGGRAYMVGENGPELFVPPGDGRIERGSQSGGREVRVAIAIHTPAPSDAMLLRQSSRQVARAVRSAIKGRR